MNDSAGYKMAAKRNKYVECWGADKPFANINETALATNIGLAVSTLGRALLLPPSPHQISAAVWYWCLLCYSV